MSRTILAVSPWGNSMSDIKMFSKLCDTYIDATKHPLTKASALLLWGGTDIHPQYYKQKSHPYNGCIGDSQRDITEWHLMHEAKRLAIPIIGVCRGAQFLCAFAGGALYQHVNGHTKDHLIETNDNNTFLVTSSHHQMMDPTGVEHELIAWSKERLSTTYQKEKLDEVRPLPHKEAEIVWFPEVKGFAIQPHPEWMENDGEFNKWLLETMQLYTDLQTEKV